MNASLARWAKFNLVGAIGTVVQFAALFILKSGLHWNYLVATALAVEAAVLHNFLWHERFTWADRVPRSGNRDRSARLDFIRLEPRPGFPRRLWRFHLANGAVSILGNLMMMKALVGLGHMNYVIANMIAIAVCSVGNFLISNEWVFM